jgi:ectoine hydroxylase-related dioxygenase (phytanoyl-CoA dioxygenase family)
VDVDRLVNAIDDEGYAELGYLPEQHVAQILAYCENSKQIEYWNPHKHCEIVDRISRNNTLVAIVRKYLGAEPILWLTQLRWSFASSDNRMKHRPLFHRKPSQYDAHDFHYDAHDFKSLTVFIYLTDVNLDSGPHMIIPRSHKNKTLRDLAQIFFKDDVAQKLYQKNIKPILGNKGLVFLEDTSSYHKAAVCKKERRLLLSIDYVLRRKLPPENLA